MKILYIITKSNWGGAQRNIYDLATSMKEKGYTAVVALGGDGILRKKLEDAGVKTHSISKLKRDISIADDNNSFWDIFSIIKRERPDIIHLHSPKAAGMGAVAGRLLGVKKIYQTVHGFAFNEDRPLFQKGLIVFFSWLTMLLVHKTIVLSQKEYRQTTYFPWVKGKFVLIPLGMKQPIFMSIDGARQMLGKNSGIDLGEFNKRIVIGTIAELHKNKGLNYLINAMEQVSREHDNALCIVIGDGDEKEKLAEMVKVKNLGDRIKFLGFVDDASHYLKGLNIFILPSVKEGLPFALIEAGFASLPVIATTVGGIPEIIEDMKSGVLVQTKNSRELSHAIAFMIEHPQMRRQYGATLRESVMQKFTLERMVEETEKLYLDK